MGYFVLFFSNAIEGYVCILNMLMVRRHQHAQEEPAWLDRVLKTASKIIVSISNTFVALYNNISKTRAGHIISD